MLREFYSVYLKVWATELSIVKHLNAHLSHTIGDYLTLVTKSMAYWPYSIERVLLDVGHSLSPSPPWETVEFWPNALSADVGTLEKPAHPHDRPPARLSKLEFEPGSRQRPVWLWDYVPVKDSSLILFIWEAKIMFLNIY